MFYLRLQVALDIAATVNTLTRYWTRVVPHARAEIAKWRRRARLIRDPAFRDHALHNLHGENLNAEAAAVFSLLAPVEHRRRLTSLLVTFQVMYDYLDTITEQPAPDPLGTGLRLHEALPAVFSTTAQPSYFATLPGDDGGYLTALVEACRADLQTLPARASIAITGRRAAIRCGQAQSYTHAARFSGVESLASWARDQA